VLFWLNKHQTILYINCHQNGVYKSVNVLELACANRKYDEINSETTRRVVAAQQNWQCDGLAGSVPRVLWSSQITVGSPWQLWL
jgi:hypothetical protein